MAFLAHAKEETDERARAGFLESADRYIREAALIWVQHGTELTGTTAEWHSLGAKISYRTAMVQHLLGNFKAARQATWAASLCDKDDTAIKTLCQRLDYECDQAGIHPF